MYLLIYNMELKLFDQTNAGVLFMSKKISKPPKSFPLGGQISDLDKGNLTFSKEEKRDYMEAFKLALTEQEPHNLTLESRDDIDWVKLLKKLKPKLFNQLIEQILPSRVFDSGQKVQVLRNCRKNIIRWFQNEKKEDNRGGRLVHEEDEKFFYDEVERIIRGMSERRPAELQEKVQGVLAGLAKKYGKELKGNEFSKNKKSGYMKENPKLKKLWEKLPYPKKSQTPGQMTEEESTASHLVEFESPIDLEFEFGLDMEFDPFDPFLLLPQADGEQPGRCYEDMLKEFFAREGPICGDMFDIM